jgi:V8-like Glu-specific endopeptidase
MGHSVLSMISVFAILAGCGEKLPHGSKAQTVFDNPDIRLLTTSERDSNSTAGAVGNLLVVLQDPSNPEQKFTIPFCTGFQISPRHVMTAAHCQRDNMVFDKNQLSEAEDIDKLNFMAFEDLLRLSFDGEKIAAAAKATDNAIMAKVVFKDEALDVMVYESTSGTDAHFVDLSHIGDSTSDQNGQLELYGFPNGVPLSVAGNCTGKRLNGLSGDRFFHNCDAMKGSSGGLIINAAGLPIALHVAGPTENSGFYYDKYKRFESNAEIASYSGCENLGTDAEKSACIAEFGHNKSIQLSDVVAAIKQNSPELWKQIGGSGCEKD